MHRHLLIASLVLCTSAYAQVSEQISFMHEGFEVYGTLAHPGPGGPYPTVLLMPGTGANDRDVTVTLQGANATCLYPGLVGTTIKPFRDLSDALVEGGFAELRYDKLEYTYPTTLGEITFQKLWLPAESALEFLRTRAEVDPTRIALLGHSEGSTLAPHVALSDGAIAAIVSLAGPRAPLDSLLAYQLEYIAQTCGGNVSEAQTQGQQITQYFAMVRVQGWNAGTPPLFGVSAPVWYDYIQVADGVAANYAQTGLPTLFLSAEDDFNVPPSELERFQNELGPLAEYGSFPGLNHFLTTATEPVVSELLADSVVSWLTARMLTVGITENSLAGTPLWAAPSGNGLLIQGIEHPRTTIIIYDAAGKLVEQGTMDTDGHFPMHAQVTGMVMVQAIDIHSRRTIRMIMEQVR